MIARSSRHANLFFARSVERLVREIELINGKCNLRFIHPVRDSIDA